MCFLLVCFQFVAFELTCSPPRNLWHKFAFYIIFSNGYSDTSSEGKFTSILFRNIICVVLITSHNFRNLIFYDSLHHLYVTYLNVQVSATSYTKSHITTEKFAQAWCCWNRWTSISRSVHSLLLDLSLSIYFCKASNFYYLFLLVGHVVAALWDWNRYSINRIEYQKYFSWNRGVKIPVRRSANLTTFICEFSYDPVFWTSWSWHGLSRPLMGLLYSTLNNSNHVACLILWRLRFVGPKYTFHYLNYWHDLDSCR